jgi:hypothetical protein
MTLSSRAIATGAPAAQVPRADERPICSWVAGFGRRHGRGVGSTNLAGHVFDLSHCDDAR